MESASHPQEGERSRPPPFPRAASRSSTSSTKTRTTHLSSNGSFTQLPPSPQHSAAHPTHRFHHSTCGRGSTERPRSQLSREASEDSRQSLPPVSSFLQERLQRERKVESERSSSRLSNETMNASFDHKTAQSSPARSGVSDGRRPRSSGGADPVKKKQGLGVKEMEQTLSTLHKQNFDLKLELYHRRERQTALEERLEKLETDKIQTDEMNDKLIVELEKRDKAVEEAVAMIVVLEARVEQLLREREMVRRVEDHGFHFSRNETPTPSEMATPRRTDFARSSPEDEGKILARMPSFLSEQSEATSNLRNVYLGVRGSILSLSKTAEDGQDQEREDLQGTRSPSLSVLSESSFRSIYGEKDVPGSSDSSPSPPHMEPAPFDGLSESGSFRPSLSGDKSNIVTPSKLRRVESRNMSAGAAKFQNINDILDVAASPLQRLEKLEKTLTAMDDASRPSTAYERKTDSRPSTGRPVKPGARPQTKQEKRDALERVLTNGHHPSDFRNSQGLPPTPDTISTSTLRRFKNSNDTLPKEIEFAGDRSYLALSETTGSQQSITPEKTERLGGSRNDTAQPVSTTAFDGLKEVSSDASYFNGRFSSAQIPRPRSADETTISNRRGGRGRGNWESDESDDELDGAGSVTSTFDYWMRESLSPNRAAALNPFSSASQAGTKHDGRISPDLFSFPTSTSGWATDAMFGTLGGSGYVGSAGGALPTATPLAQTLDALGDSLPQPLFGSGLASSVLGGAVIPPPPPNRRSSLHARTGSSHGMVTGISSSPAGPSPSHTRLRTSPRRSRERSNSIDGPPNSSRSSARAIAAQMGRAPTAPPQSPMPVPDAPQQQPKQRHYPPTASQPARSRGLNNLFRRSTGSAADVQPPASAPATETSFKNVPAPMVGVPTSWGSRKNGNDVFADDDRASATPPPIMRNRRGSFDGGARLDGGAPVGPPAQNSLAQSPANGIGSAAVNGAPVKNEGGGKRKWLGFGRASSLRNRAG
ncbi:hypothetical protein CONLIGDRAFT_453658 [Coniochaeta ligniaria NRRL 30616]|uniref:Centrosomin N-terminal motif 1 domain-containing protein n=1 Tax=Coniochaeta ligniaria NRRL 30616 TaxID=1408157 RepID=A0A1J7IKG3_9PEZI|nr:hypothetical protein CONLIGDRAFT_453658 [Coniochaeta ligniaria NRRL 30616]